MFRLPERYNSSHVANCLIFHLFSYQQMHITY
uniref:Uncharacterized protein n=1 Tax=Arundo donax TaxID=35708 RepID=A0A0A9GJV5_ARUDO